ncbi:MAG: class I SAM-dependent methyltransferase [Verrucomicrobiae bacterium]|nr:class I SAM-dependent methyltransferase [Verrucomicrobiae bacterium]
MEEGQPLGWFEQLYEKADSESVPIPWADLVPNPNVVALFDERGIKGEGKLALKVGAGLGDDAEYLDALGFEVVAFDISPTAVRLARKRFPNSRVEYLVADLFQLPEAWRGRFDFIWESYTLQVLPPDLRRKAIGLIPGLLAENGELVVVSRARSEDDPEGEMPWPLLESELRMLERVGLDCLSFEDYTDGEAPPVRRFRSFYRKASDHLSGSSPGKPP